MIEEILKIFNSLRKSVHECKGDRCHFNPRQSNPLGAVANNSESCKINNMNIYISYKDEGCNKTADCLTEDVWCTQAPGGAANKETIDKCNENTVEKFKMEHGLPIPPNLVLAFLAKTLGTLDEAKKIKESNKEKIANIQTHIDNLEKQKGGEKKVRDYLKKMEKEFNKEVM